MFSRLGFMPTLLALLVGVSWSCGGETALLPHLVLEGEGVGPDPQGKADYAIDFGKLVVGRSHNVTVEVANTGSARLEVRFGWPGDRVPLVANPPFALAPSPAFSVKPGRRHPFAITFSGDEEGTFEALIHVSSNDGRGKRSVRLIGEAVRSRIACTPSPLDLGYVLVGEERAAQLDCRNELEIPTSIALGRTTGPARSSFNALLPAGAGVAEVLPGESISIGVRFTADDAEAPAQAFLPLLDPSGSAVQEIELVAHPSEFALQWLHEEEEELVPLSGCFTFPETQLMEEAKGSLWLRNIGREPVEIAELSFDPPSPHFPSIQTSFEVTKTLAQEEAVRIDFLFRPLEGRNHQSELVAHGAGERATPAEGIRACIRGKAIELPPCDIEIIPPRIDFGVVDWGWEREHTRTVRLLNRSKENACLLRDLRLAPDSDDVFSVEPIDAVILAPRPAASEETADSGHILPVEIHFAPHDSDTFQGNVDFTFSHPDDPTYAIPLTGTNQSSCLEFEGEVDMGVAPPGCGGATRTIRIRHRCGPTGYLYSVDFKSIQIQESSPQFVLLEAPETPFELDPLESFELKIFFQPDGVGPFAGNLTIEANERSIWASTFQVGLHGYGQQPPVQTDTFTDFDQKVDVLWVVDNTKSMGEVQALLQEKVPLFMRFANEQGIDFQIGVTTAGTDLGIGSACPETGYGNFNEWGRLVPHPSLGRPRLLDSSLPPEEVESALAQNLQVGACNHENHGAVYDAVKWAHSRTLLLTPLEKAGNEGLMRRDAALSIIGVTKGADSLDPEPVQSAIDFLRGIKAAEDRDRIRFHMLSGGAEPCTSSLGDAQACPRCMEGPAETGGLFIPLCMDGSDPRWDEIFLELSEKVFGYETILPLRGPPADANGDGILDEKDFEVLVDGRALTILPTNPPSRVWRYDADSNSIAFSPLYRPGAGQVVEVSYQLGCLDYD